MIYSAFAECDINADAFVIYSVFTECDIFSFGKCFGRLTPCSAYALFSQSDCRGRRPRRPACAEINCLIKNLWDHKNVPLDKIFVMFELTTCGTPSGEEARRLRWRVKPCWDKRKHRASRPPQGKRGDNVFEGRPLQSSIYFSASREMTSSLFSVIYSLLSLILPTAPSSPT